METYKTAYEKSDILTLRCTQMYPALSQMTILNTYSQSSEI